MTWSYLVAWTSLFRSGQPLTHRSAFLCLLSAGITDCSTKLNLIGVELFVCCGVLGCGLISVSMTCSLVGQPNLVRQKTSFSFVVQMQVNANPKRALSVSFKVNTFQIIVFFGNISLLRKKGCLWYKQLRNNSLKSPQSSTLMYIKHMASLRVFGYIAI